MVRIASIYTAGSWLAWVPWGSGSGKPFWQLQTGSAEKGRAALRGTVAVPSPARLGPAATAQVPQGWTAGAARPGRRRRRTGGLSSGAGHTPQLIAQWCKVLRLLQAIDCQYDLRHASLANLSDFTSDLHNRITSCHSQQRACTGTVAPTRIKVGCFLEGLLGGFAALSHERRPMEEAASSPFTPPFC